MTPATRPSLKDRMLDVIFGRRLEGSALEHFRAEQPPKWIRRILLLSFLLWIGMLAYWGIGKLGWLPDRFVKPPPHSAISTSGIVWSLALFGVREYFRKRAARASRGAQ
jgi:hypothetical protein